jgi:hypothetical protein
MMAQMHYPSLLIAVIPICLVCDQQFCMVSISPSEGSPCSECADAQRHITHLVDTAQDP